MSENRNIEKPPKARKPKHSLVLKSSEKPFKDSEEHTRNTGNKNSTLGSLNDDSGRFTPNFKTRGDFIGMSPQIVDLFDRVEKRTAINSTNSNDSIKINRNKQHEFKNHQRFSDLMNSYDSEIFIDGNKQKYIMDAHIQVADDYHARQLLGKAWRSLMLHKVNMMQINLVSKIGDSYYNKHLLTKSFQSLFKNNINCKVERTENYKSDEYFRIKTLRKYLENWRMITSEQVNENKAVEDAKTKLEYKRKLAIMLKWKE